MSLPSSTSDSSYRWVRAGIPIALISLVVALVAIAAEMPFRDWSGARLAWSAAIDYGYGAYSGPDSGPVLSSIYGPVSPLLFWPALLVGDITWAMIAGCVINIATCVGPMLVLVWWGRRRKGDSGTIGWAAFAIAVASMLVLPSVRNLTHNIHVDAAAVGFGLLSCIMLFGPDRAPSGLRLTAAAAFTALAVWTKQVEITLGMAQVLYIWLVFGWRVMIGFVWRVAVFGLGLGGVFVAWFGFDGMWFHMWTIPAHHPMAQFVQLEPERRAFSPSYRLIVGELVKWGSPFVAAILAVQFATPKAERRWMRQDWFLLLLVAGVLFPTSVLARAKVGGWINSYHTHYFLVAAAVLAVVQFLDRWGSERPMARRVFGVVFALAIAAFWCPVHLKGLKHLPELHDNPQRQVYDYALAHPGEAWFPWHPLAVLLAEGKLYHFYYAMVDRDISERRMTPEHIAAHLPDGMRYVIHNQKAIRPGWDPLPNLPRYLPELREAAELPELPGWTVLER